ncbi:MAG TPA: hypothetical protein VGA61_03350 [Anaerolineae bacterium]
MEPSSITGLRLVEESEASGEVADIYAEAKRLMQTPFVPNMLKVIAISPAALAIYWEAFRAFLQYSTLPQALSAMILYAIAERNHCQYCSASHEMTCRALGIDEATLARLVNDLGNVSPERVREIIRFALKINSDPQGLVARDYDRVRAVGVTDEEMVEIIMLAAHGRMSDTLADGFKIKVDQAPAEALEF